MPKHIAAEPLEFLADQCLAESKRKQYPLDILSAGGYLHLEVSELIEALRGKRGNAEHEAADVLFQLLTIIRSRRLNIDRILKRLEKLAPELE